MKKSFFILLFLFFCLPLCLFSQDASDASKPSAPKVLVVPVSETVDFGLSKFIERAALYGEASGARHIIFDVDTFGGLVDSVFLITRTITGLRGKVPSTTYISTKAISAGALIALSCEDMYMNESATIGDCAPISIGREGPTMLGEKFQSPIRAEFRKLARLNGYPELLSEAMVTEDIEVIQVTFDDGIVEYMTPKQVEELSEVKALTIKEKKTIVEKGRLLTMNAHEAVEYGFAKKIVTGLDDVIAQLGLKDPVVEHLEETWAEKAVRYIDKLAPFFFFIGIMALYFELKIPGFGLPGILAIVCFAIIFCSKYMIGLAGYEEILLFLVGVIFIGLEIFVIPGFGITGIAGIFCVVISLYLAGQPFIIPKFSWQWDYLYSWCIQFGVSFVLSCVGIVVLGKYLPKTPLYKRITLSSALTKEEGYTAHTVPLVKDGDKGTAKSSLRPYGRALMGGRNIEVVTRGEFIKKGVEIEVYAVEGNKVIVKEAGKEQETS